MWPGCWQLKQTIGLSDENERRLGGGTEEELEETDRFLKEKDEVLEDLLAADMAFAICFRSPVSC